MRTIGVRNPKRRQGKLRADNVANTLSLSSAKLNGYTENWILRQTVEGKTMKTTTTFVRFVICCLTATLAGLSPQMVQAQDDDPGYIHLRIIELHANKVADFEELVKQRSAAESDAGIGFNHVFQRLRGIVNAFLIVSPGYGNDVADIDLPDDWGPSISQTIKSHTVVTAMIGPGTLSSGSPAPTGEYLYVRLRDVAPGNVELYADWQENKLLPALREIGVNDVRTARVVLGGSPERFVRFAFMDDWPGQGGGPGGDLSGILAEESTMVRARQNLFYRFRDDLSFTADSE